MQNAPEVRFPQTDTAYLADNGAHFLKLLIASLIFSLIVLVLLCEKVKTRNDF